MSLKEKIQNNQLVKRIQEPKNKFWKTNRIVGLSIFAVGFVAALPIAIIPASIAAASTAMITGGLVLAGAAQVSKKGTED